MFGVRPRRRLRVLERLCVFLDPSEAHASAAFIAPGELLSGAALVILNLSESCATRRSEREKIMKRYTCYTISIWLVAVIGAGRNARKAAFTLRRSAPVNAPEQGSAKNFDASDAALLAMKKHATELKIGGVAVVAYFEGDTLQSGVRRWWWWPDERCSLDGQQRLQSAGDRFTRRRRRWQTRCRTAAAARARR